MVRPSWSWVSSSAGHVRPPTGHADVAGQFDREIVTFAARQIPHARSRPAFALVHDGEALVAGDRRPTRGVNPEAGAVPLLAAHRAGARVEHAQRAMDAVAVLAVGEAHEACRRARGRDRHVLAVLVQQLGGRALAADGVHRVAAHLGSVAVPTTIRPSPSARPAPQPSGRSGASGPGQRPSGRFERHPDPAAGLVAAVVVEPHDTLAVGRDDTVHHADGMVGHPPPDAGRRGPTPTPATTRSRSTRRPAGRARRAPSAGTSPVERGSAAPTRCRRRRSIGSSSGRRR